ncbi:MAG: energy-coupling factor ABC transporter ATP-binding protein [SAR324 cluster bacterium]
MPEPTPPSLLPLHLERVSFVAGGRTLLAEITLTLGAGVPIFVLGPNGAGKTLLLRTCHGLLSPTSGTLRWGGADRSTALKRQAMVFQRPILLRRSAAGNIEHALRVRGFPGREIPGRAAAALSRVGLEHLAHRPARVLSGGEQQRVAIARAWALEPELLLLDEPTANLDPSATQAIEEAIAALHAAGVALIVASHDLAQARRLARRIVFLHRGRVLDDAPAESFFAQPRSPEARAFLRGDLLT